MLDRVLHVFVCFVALLMVFFTGGAITFILPYDQSFGRIKFALAETWVSFAIRFAVGGVLAVIIVLYWYRSSNKS